MRPYFSCSVVLALLGAPFLSACGGVLFETRARVVSVTRASATARVEASAPPRVAVTVSSATASVSASPPTIPTLPGFEAPSTPASVAAAPTPTSAGSSPDEQSGSARTRETNLERSEVARAGVWALDGGRAHLSDLLTDGVQVDGVVVRLRDLNRHRDLDLGEGGSRLASGPNLEAWTELEHASLPSVGGETRLVIGLRAPLTRPAGPRAPLRVHLVIDRSSSMQRTWAQMLDAARELIGELRPEDQLQIVAYGTEAAEALPLARVGDGARAERALAAISVGGGTHIEAGLRMAYRSAASARDGSEPDGTAGLVLLLSDGVPNRGAFDAGELGALAAEAALRSGCTTSVVGLGTRFDAEVLQRIASEGGGSYSVAWNVDRLARTLIEETRARGWARARQVALQVELPSRVELLGVDGARREGQSASLQIPSLRPGQRRRVVLRVRVPASTSGMDVARVWLSYRGEAGTATASRTVRVSVGAHGRLRSSPNAASALLDADLNHTIERTSAATQRGDGTAAAAAMLEHASLLEGHQDYARNPQLRARAQTARRLGRALGELAPTASEGQRRAVALELGAIAQSF